MFDNLYGRLVKQKRTVPKCLMVASGKPSAKKLKLYLVFCSLNRIFAARNQSTIIMTLETKKRKYQKPAMQVFELKEHARLLAGSGLGTPTDYPKQPGDPFA